MSKGQSKTTKGADLRVRAETHLRESARWDGLPNVAGVDAAKLVHELLVHQLELEMQNEELRRSRAEVEIARERFADLYDFAPVGYLTLARDGAIRELNLTAARMLGTERSRLVARRFGLYVAAEARSVFNGALAGAFEHPVPVSCELELAPLGEPTSDASGPRFVRLVLSAAVGGDECRVAASDVTEIRRAEDRLRSAQKVEAIGKLAGGVAHDFNNLLTIILAESDAALAAVEAGKTPSDDLRAIREAATRAAALTRQLLAYARKQVLRRELVDLNEHVRGAATMFPALLGEHVETVLRLAEDLGRIEIDRVQLNQVLVNLAVNARDAMPEGGTLTLATENLVLDAAHADRFAVEPGPFVRLTVRDTGVGMAPATASRMFEPFFTTKAAGLGTGLGLATVSGVVKQCGGEILVHTELGKGTTFEIYLPRAAGFPSQGTRKANAAAARCGTETILVVDDEAALGRVAQRILEAAGYTVILAQGGDEALRLCALHDGPVHLVLSDVIMPEMSGTQLAGRLKTERPEARVLFMSGFLDDVLGRGGVLGLEVDFLAKPFSAGALEHAVREALDRTQPLVA